MKSEESDALPSIPNVQKPNMLLRARTALRRWLHGLAPNATVEDFRTIALIYLVTTALLWALAYGAMSVFPENRKVPGAWHITPVQVWDVWFRWDSGNYHNIACRGYQAGRNGVGEAPWFPFYPYIVAVLMPAKGYRFLMALAVSNICFFLALLVLFDVVAPWLGKDVACLSVLYLSIFPSAVFFRAPYTESLFTLLVLLSYRGYVRERYGQCGLFGAMAAMTRFPGIMLFPAFGATAVWEIVWKRRPFRPAMLLLGLIPVGLGLVMLNQGYVFGDPLAFFHAVGGSEHNRRVSFPGASLIGDWWYMRHVWDFTRGQIDFQLMLDDLVLLAAIAGAFCSFRRYGFLAGVLSFCLLLPPLMSGRTIGMIRYVLPIFFYVVLLAETATRHPWFHSLWVYVSGLLLAFYAIAYACWYWAA
jgi:hypothetical protein